MLQQSAKKQVHQQKQQVSQHHQQRGKQQATQRRDDVGGGRGDGMKVVFLDLDNTLGDFTLMPKIDDAIKFLFSMYTDLPVNNRTNPPVCNLRIGQFPEVREIFKPLLLRCCFRPQLKEFLAELLMMKLAHVIDKVVLYTRSSNYGGYITDIYVPVMNELALEGLREVVRGQRQPLATIDVGGINFEPFINVEAGRTADWEQMSIFVPFIPLPTDPARSYGIEHIPKEVLFDTIFLFGWELSLRQSDLGRISNGLVFLEHQLQGPNAPKHPLGDAALLDKSVTLACIQLRNIFGRGCDPTRCIFIDDMIQNIRQPTHHQSWVGAKTIQPPSYINRCTLPVSFIDKLVEWITGFLSIYTPRTQRNKSGYLNAFATGLNYVNYGGPDIDMSSDRELLNIIPSMR